MEQSNTLNRERQLKDLGFEKNEHQRCFYQWKYGCGWTINFSDLEENDNIKWELSLKNYKKILIEAKKEQEESELYILGRKSAEKELKQKITDLYNKYNSHHQQVTQFKLDKTVNQDYRIKLEAKLEVLGELRNKL